MTNPEDKGNEFLNPKSMLTPGACGAIVMGITNALATNLNMHGSTRMLLCLGLSFLIGTLVFAAGIKQVWQKLVFYVFNSLIIFTMGAGVNSASQTVFNASTTDTDNPPPAAIAASTPAPSSPSVGAAPTSVHHVPLMTTNPVTAASTNRLNLKAVKVRSQFFEHWH
jgi:hypothetical protein